MSAARRVSELFALSALAALAAVLCAPSAGACPEPAATGTQPCDTALRGVIQSACSGTLGAAGAPIHEMNSGLGTARHNVPGHVPCVLMSAVAQTESTWHQFGYVACGARATTLLSADCGYGIAQVTSGMDGSGGFAPSRVAAEPAYNVSVGVNILIQKWQNAPDLGNNDPSIAEDWYFALWGYNGFAATNNPNQHSDTRGTYYNPTAPAYPRNHYPYQELVYGYARYPAGGSDGAPRWPAVTLTHMNFSEICGACGTPSYTTTYTQPTPTHAADCVATGPEWGAQFVAQSFPYASQPAAQMRAGETLDAWIELRNTGTRAWDGNTRLATTAPRDRASALAGPGWVAPHRPAAVSGTVPPGGTFRFRFALHAPATPGRYDEHFGVVQEGVHWFSDPGQGGPPDDQLEGVFDVLPGDGPPPVRMGDGAVVAVDAGPSAGRSDGGTLPDGAAVTRPSVGCGCAVPRRRSTAPVAAMVLVVAAVLAGRHRARSQNLPGPYARACARASPALSRPVCGC
jgi:hypothetical protein